MREWNYKSKTYSSTGYDDLYPILDTYTKEKYIGATKEEQDIMVEEVFNIYRSRDIFPIVYYNDEGVKGEILRAIEAKPYIKDDVVIGSGFTRLCNFFFPNYYDAFNIYGMSGGYGQSGNFKFTDEVFFKRVIRFAIKSKGDVKPQGIYDGFKMVGNLPTNFVPMRAKAIYELLCPENGIVWDYCCGYGGRMLGCLSSKKNFTYIGTEPNTETYENLIKFGKAIESVTKRENSFRVLRQGSEVVEFKEDVFDFAFSSPPYFNLEHYSDEPTQCYIKFPDIYSWIDGYVRQTIYNIYKYLKHDRYYAVNIADFISRDGKILNYVDIWKDLSIKEGFRFYKDLYLNLSVPCGNGERNKFKKERIMVFYKE